MSHPVYEYRPLKNLNSALVVLLYIFVALNVFSLISDYMEMQLLTKYLDGEFVSDEMIESNDTRQALLGILILGFLIVLYFVFGKWIYRSSANAHFLAPSYMTHSPGWAVGSYFIPILNFFRPFESMKEVWQVSAVQPDQEPADVSTPGFMRLWWALWLITRVTGTLVFYVLKDATVVEQFIVADKLSIGDGVCIILLSLAAIRLVNRVSEAQQDRGEVPLESEGVLVCLECGESIDAAAAACPMCGASVQTAQFQFGG
jgi:hypothetical protein